MFGFQDKAGMFCGYLGVFICFCFPSMWWVGIHRPIKARIL